MKIIVEFDVRGKTEKLACMIDGGHQHILDDLTVVDDDRRITKPIHTLMQAVKRKMNN